MRSDMGIYTVPMPENEPVRSYEPGSADREAIEKAISTLKDQQIDIPLFINGREVRTDKKIEIRSPHNHDLVLGYYHQAGEKEIRESIDSALEAQAGWSTMPWEHRASIFLKAADLLAGPYRYIVNAATMLAHSKNVFQAEIDAVCELVDFWRFNAAYM